MSERNLTFDIRPRFDGRATVEAKKLTGELTKAGTAEKKLTDEQKKQTDALEKKRKRWEEFLKGTETGLDRLRKSLTGFGRDTKTAFEMGPLRGINQLQRGAEQAVGKLFTLKNAILGTALGYGAYRVGSAIFREGGQQLRAEGMARRTVGGDPSKLIAQANAIGLKAGIQGDEAVLGLIPVLQSIQATTQAGMGYRGKKLTETQAEAVRQQTFGVGAKLYQRLATLAPDVEPQQLGLLLAQAGTGREGIRGLVSALGLNKAIAKRIEDEGIKKHLGQGEILEKLLNASGLTEEAAAGKRKNFNFQIKSMGAQLQDALGDIGTTAMRKLNESLGKGTTLAEKLEKYLSSKEGKQMIDKLGESLSHVVEFMADLAKKIPAAFDWVIKHKELIMGIGGAWLGLKGVGAVTSAFSSPLAALAGKGGGGVVGKLAGVVGAAGAQPVFITNWPAGIGMGGGVGGKGGGWLGKAAGVLGVGALAYEAGTALDNYFDISGKANKNRFSNALGSYQDAERQQEEMRATMQQAAKLEAQKRLKGQHIEQLVNGLGMTPAQAAYYSEHPGALSNYSASGGAGGAIQLTANLVLDGQKVASVTEKHLIRQGRNRKGD